MLGIGGAFQYRPVAQECALRIQSFSIIERIYHVILLPPPHPHLSPSPPPTRYIDDETEGAASSVTAEAAETDEAAAAEDGTAGVGKKRKFHNLRERQRRFLIRDLFISLRDAIPELAARDSVADREILVEARATIKELEEQSELLQQKLEEQRRRSADLMAARTAATAKRNGGGSDASSGSTSPAPSTSDYGSEGTCFQLQFQVGCRLFFFSSLSSLSLFLHFFSFLFSPELWRTPTHA